MARARNIKPGFFKNEDLAECSPWARLCFIGLWTLADRAGRLEDRPKRIKGELFPYDTVDVEPLLQELARYGFIERYETDGVRVIAIPKFADHQKPHSKEKPSELPEKVGASPEKVGASPEKVGASTDLGSGEHALNPSCLNPSCLNPEEETTNKPPPESRGREAESSSSPPWPVDNPEPPDKPPVPLPDKIPDAAPSRQAQIAVLLKRNGADPASHPASNGIAGMVALNLTDTEILLALATAKQNRQASGSAQAITASYLLGIAKGQRQDRQKPARGPPDRRSRYAEQSRQIAEMSAQADAVILAHMAQTAQPPAEIDMGVIDASPAT